MKRLWLLAATAALLSCAPEQESAPDPVESDPPLAQASAGPVANVVSSPSQASIAPLTPQGWGPLRIGMTLSEIEAAAGPDSDPGAVGGPEPEACDIFHPANAPEGLRVMVEEGRLTRISISRPTEVRTDRNLGPGNAAEAVEAAYGAELVSSPHEYEEAPAEYLTVWATPHGEEPYVQAPDSRGIRYEVDGSGTVEVVHAGGPSIQYVEGCL